MELPVRKPTRIPGYDYSEQNYYFITVCTHEKKCIFYTNGKMNLFGKIAEDCLREIPSHFYGIRLDQYVVMPNHIHAILALETQTINVTEVVGLYKSSVSRRIHSSIPDLKIWQRSFHDHIIRNRRSYEKIWQYIETNPMRWFEDCFYSDKDM